MSGIGKSGIPPSVQALQDAYDALVTRITTNEDTVGQVNDTAQIAISAAADAQQAVSALHNTSTTLGEAVVALRTRIETLEGTHGSDVDPPPVEPPIDPPDEPPVDPPIDPEPEPSKPDIPFPAPRGKQAFPYRGFFDGNGVDYYGMTQAAFIAYLAKQGVNAAPYLVGDVTPGRVDRGSYQSALSEMGKQGFVPSTSAQMRRMALWYDTRVMEGAAVYEVPMVFGSDGHLTAREPGPASNVPPLGKWTRPIAWTLNGDGSATVQGNGGVTDSLATTLDVVEGPYVLTWDAVVTGDVTAQVYAMIDNQSGLTVAAKGFKTGTQYLELVIPPGSTKLGVRVRCKDGTGSFVIDNVKMVPLHQRLQNLIIAPDSRLELRLPDGTLLNEGADYRIGSEYAPVKYGTSPLNGPLTTVTAISARAKGATVSMAANIACNPDKPFPVVTDWALARWKEHLLLPTKAVFDKAGVKPKVVFGHVNELRGINRDARARKLGLSNARYVAHVIDRMASAIRAVFGPVFIIFWADWGYVKANGGDDEQFRYGSDRGGTADAVKYITTKGCAFVPWYYTGTPDPAYLLGYINTFLDNGLDVILGPGLAAANMTGTLDITRPLARAGKLLGVQYQVYHGRYQGVEEMIRYRDETIA